MSKKKLMILGAGIYQVPLIKKAKEMGLETLVVSIKGNYPGIALADSFYEIDTRDYEKILETAKREKISGICTSGTDVAVRAIGFVCDNLGLRGIPREAAWKVTDKLLMKEALKAGGVSTADFRKVASYEECVESANALGFPVMVKAVDSSGSRGIHRADRMEELEYAWQEAKKVTKKPYVLVEEFIEADEIGVDAFIGEEKIEAFFPHEKFTYTVNGTTMPIGHKFPYHASKKLMENLKHQIELAIKALGMKNCPLNADVFVRGEQVWLIEVGGRTGATCIPELISIYTGYDWYEKIISYALGENAEFQSEETHPCMGALLFSNQDGIIEKIEMDKLKSLVQKGIEVQLDYQVGDKIEAMKNGTDRIGQVIMRTGSEAELEEALSHAREAVWLSKGNLEERWKN